VSDVSTAPWNEYDVQTLNLFQSSAILHPYTCGDELCRRSTMAAPLVAHPDGWRCQHCSYTQNWASSVMLDRGLLERMQASRVFTWNTDG
jgi:hypothetical protein